MSQLYELAVRIAAVNVSRDEVFGDCHLVIKPNGAGYATLDGFGSISGADEAELISKMQQYLIENEKPEAAQD